MKFSLQTLLLFLAMLFGIVNFVVAQNNYKTKVEKLVEEVKKHDKTNIPKAIELHKELLSFS